MKCSHPLKHITTPLVGISRLPFIPKDNVTFIITIGQGTNVKTIMVDFLVVNCPSSNNYILGKPFLYGVRVVAATDTRK